MTIEHRLRGYQKHGSALLVEFALPPEVVRTFKKILGDKEDPDLFQPHPLEQSQVYKIATALERPIDTKGLEFFIEAVADWDTIRRVKSVAKMR